MPLLLSLTPSLRKNFHQYSTNYKSKYNVDYSLGILAGVTYEYTEKVHLALSGSYALNRTYNKINKEKFGLEEEITILINDEAVVGLGHRNGGSAVKADGGSNVGIYDKINSEFYTYLTYSM